MKTVNKLQSAVLFFFAVFTVSRSKDDTVPAPSEQSCQFVSEGGTSQAGLHELYLTKYIDRASPVLAKMAESEKRIPEVSITLRNMREGEFTILLNDATISSYSPGTTEDKPESISFTYQKIIWT